MSLVRKCDNVDHCTICIMIFHLCCCWRSITVQKCAFWCFFICLFVLWLLLLFCGLFVGFWFFVVVVVIVVVFWFLGCRVQVMAALLL